MADVLTTDAVPGFPGLNIEYVNVSPTGQVTLQLDYPASAPKVGGGSYDQFVYALLHVFYASEFDFTDQTTGTTYHIGEVPMTIHAGGGDGRTYLNELITFQTDSSDLTGYLQGELPCFATGTSLATPNGLIAVEDLRPGDIVTTLAGPAAVTWTGHRRARDTDVIRVRAGTLGARRDLILSEDHALHVGGCLVPAGLLVDGEGIVRERREDAVFWHVELERHAILLAEGVEAESYLDTGNRRQFGNCPLAYDPVQAIQDPCAEMLLAGIRLEELRASVAQTAERSFGLRPQPIKSSARREAA